MFATKFFAIKELWRRGILPPILRLAQDGHPARWPVSTLYFQCSELHGVNWQVSAGCGFEGNVASVSLTRKREGDPFEVRANERNAIILARKAGEAPRRQSEGFCS